MIHLTNPNDPRVRPAPVTREQVANLAFNQIGDSGLTAQGTARAIEYSQQVYGLAPGESLAFVNGWVFINQDDFATNDRGSW